jgi:hypothetical protein
LNERASIVSHGRALQASKGEVGQCRMIGRRQNCQGDQKPREKSLSKYSLQTYFYIL